PQSGNHPLKPVAHRRRGDAAAFARSAAMSSSAVPSQTKDRANRPTRRGTIMLTHPDDPIGQVGEEGITDRNVRELMLKASSHQAIIAEAFAHAGCLFDGIFEAIAPACEMLIDVDRLAHRLDEIRGELRDQSETLLRLARQIYEIER